MIIQPLSATSRVMKIGLSSEKMSMIDLSMTAYWKVRARLLGVPGVANVAMWGQRREMIFVNVDPEALHASGVTLEDAMTVTSTSLDAGLLKHVSGTLVGTGGAVETPNQRLGVRHTLPIVTADQLKRVVVGSSPEGAPIRLGDIAEVKRGFQPLSGDAVINDGEGLMLIVEKLPWANTLDVTNGVEETLAPLAPGLEGIVVDSTIFRPATFIEIAIENLTSALFIGSVLVIIILLLFLFEWRSALISAIAIPLSLLAALLVLDWRGTTINTMVLAGLVIAVGVVVDDAIIDIENIVRRLRQNRAAGVRTSARVVLEASVEVRERDHLRHLDQRRRCRAGAVPRRPDRCLLPATRPGVRAGGPGVDGGGAHRDPRPGIAAGERAARDEAAPLVRLLQRGYSAALSGLIGTALGRSSPVSPSSWSPGWRPSPPSASPCCRTSRSGTS